MSFQLKQILMPLPCTVAQEEQQTEVQSWLSTKSATLSLTQWCIPSSIVSIASKKQVFEIIWSWLKAASFYIVGQMAFLNFSRSVPSYPFDVHSIQGLHGSVYTHAQDRQESCVCCEESDRNSIQLSLTYCTNAQRAVTVWKKIATDAHTWYLSQIQVQETWYLSRTTTMSV